MGWYQRRVHGECFINRDNMKILIVLGIFWRLACSSKVDPSYLPSYEVSQHDYDQPQYKDQHEYKQEQSYLPSYEVAQHEYVKPQQKYKQEPSYKHEPSYLSSYEVAQHEYVKPQPEYAQPQHKYVQPQQEYVQPQPYVKPVAVQPHYVPQYDKGYIQPAAKYPVATTIKGTGSAKFSGTGEAFFQGAGTTKFSGDGVAAFGGQGTAKFQFGDDHVIVGSLPYGGIVGVVQGDGHAYFDGVGFAAAVGTGTAYVDGSGWGSVTGYSHAVPEISGNFKIESQRYQRSHPVSYYEPIRHYRSYEPNHPTYYVRPTYQPATRYSVPSYY